MDQCEFVDLSERDMCRRGSLNEPDTLKYQKVFNSIVSDNNGLMPVSKLQSAAVLMGYRLTDSQIKSIVKENGLDETSSVTFTTFLDILPRNKAIPNEQHRIAELRQKFQHYDTEGDGDVTLQSALCLLQQELNVAPKIAFGLLNQFVKLNYDQFIDFCGKLQQTKIDLYEKFGKYDANHDGMISVEEAHQILHKELGYTEGKSKAAVNRFDVNKDGQVSYVEFADFYFAIEEKKKNIRQTFRKFDQNNNGYVTTDQARDILCNMLGFSAAKCETTMTTFDMNKNGKIMYEKFIEFYTMIEEERDRLVAEFNRYDQNNDGRISQQEFAAMLSSEGLADEEIKTLMEGYDLDGDGFLDINEFKKYLNFS